ncbi:MAG: class IV adenylate cyclase [Geodermatophilaceae bacterium]
MGHLNVEFKARTAEPEQVLARLRQLGAHLQGVDAQSDVYYRSAQGRLKLRRGNIENSLIYYQRQDQANAKRSDVNVADLPADRAIDEVLDAALDRDVVVSKQRHILWLDNVKFHVDQVAELGAFLEVEAIDRDGTLGEEHLLTQCDHYRHLLGVRDQDLEARSYSDLLRDQT